MARKTTTRGSRSGRGTKSSQGRTTGGTRKTSTKKSANSRSASSTQRRTSTSKTSSKQGRGRTSQRGSTQTKGTGVSGNLRATDLLRDQHQQVLGLFDRFARSGNRTSREKIFDEILTNCAMHFDVEEQVFYPGLKTRNTQERLLESAEEHLGCKRILADLIDLSPDDSTFLPKIEVLRRMIQEHVEREENELFPIAERQLKRDQQFGLAQEMLRVMDDVRRGGEISERVTEHLIEAAPI